MNQSPNEKECFLGFNFDENIFVSDKYYRNDKIKHDKYSTRAKSQSFFNPIDRNSKAVEEIKEMMIRNVPSKLLDRHRKSIYRRQSILF
jgi:hypothetical protein